MTQSQYSFSWDSYQSSICGGFSLLQQNGEFVDMTLAADGHIVKVHQLLLALASPYLKELISSAPCQHPVIFLNNVNHDVLCSLLEYIYTGEVVVPAENFSSFIATAKALHIRGLENVMNAGESSQKVTLSSTDSTINSTVVRQVSIATDQGIEQIGLPSLARKVHVKRDPSNPVSLTKSLQKKRSDDSFEYSDVFDDTRNDSDDDDSTYITGDRDQHGLLNKDKQSVTNLQFTVSNRGSLQVILNRYLYNLHSTSHRNGMRRWRCVDYRNNRCPAFVITKGNMVLNRSNLHTHSFHDKKILTKIERKIVYSALDDVTAAQDNNKDTSQNDNTMDEVTMDE